VIAVVGILLTAAVAGVCLSRRSASLAPTPTSLDVGPGPREKVSANPEYVGVAVCAECHPAEYRTYRGTAHSLALSEPDTNAEPPDGSFHHAASGRNYTVYREGGHLRHRETARDATGAEYVAADYPVRYLIGSGRHTRSYLIQDDGFMFESPITWYASRQAWDMSPGYDRPNHRGFERAADATCLFCHVGRVTATGLDYQRLAIAEQPIGCERCHGPGSLHAVEERAARDGVDRPHRKHGTIVQPARLTRPLAEAVCAQCHLNGDAMVTNRGQSLDDFRPGLPLSDFCVEYCPRTPDLRMKVVGHVDQLRLSRCYRESGTLTCITCHDPHSATAPEGRRAAYVSVCLNCHSDGSCRLTPAARLRRSPGADCVTCHMPQVGTEIEHVAFTHHRIGIHGPEPAPAPSAGPAELAPVDDISGLSELDRRRNLGLAYFALSQKQAEPATAETYRARALQLLRSVRAAGMSDGEVDAALARLLRERDPATAFELAGDAIRDAKLSPKSRVNSLFLLAEVGVGRGRLDAARRALRELTAERRLSEDWLLLSACCEREGDLAGGLASLDRAAKIAPFRADLHDRLAALLRQAGQTEAADREHFIALRLAQQARLR
jgi:predicted CXXCH cytochrome family protein